MLGLSGLQEKEQALTGISEAAKRHIVNSRAKRSIIYDNLLKEYRYICCHSCSALEPLMCNLCHSLLLDILLTVVTF